MHEEENKPPFHGKEKLRDFSLIEKGPPNSPPKDVRRMKYLEVGFERSELDQTYARTDS